MNASQSWRRVRPGHHRNTYHALHVVRGDDDGQIVWQVWDRAPQDGGRPVSGPLATVFLAKRAADRRGTNA